MASITQIPAELLLQIISELDKKDISAISRSCKALQQVVHPFLYETVTWTLEERFSNIKVWEDGMAMDWKPSYEFITPPIHSYFELLLRNPVRATEMPEEELWFSVLEKGDVNAFIALLPSQLTELRRLHLSPDYYKENRFLHLFLRAAICSHDRSAKLSMFLHLEHICVSSAAEGKQLGKSYNHKSDIHYLLHLPAVRALDVGLALERMVNDSQFSWFHNKPLAISNLTTLTLRTCKT